MTKIKQIIKSRVLIFKNRNKDFYKERLSICRSCPFNSNNSDKSKIILKIINLGSYCTACGCGIKYKISIPEAICGLFDIGKEPKWEEV